MSIIEALMVLWKDFEDYTVKNVPNYVDADFNWNNFMEWLKFKYPSSNQAK